MTLSVAIVGCGKIADGHLAVLRKLGTLARTAAVCDRELLMAEQAAERFGVPAFYDDLEMLLRRHRPDVVHLLTPPATHLGLVRQALAHGCHVFVEKPVAPTLQEVEEIVARIARAQRKLCVGYNYLFDPPAMRMRRWLGQGRLGAPVHLESWYGYDLVGPFGSAIMADPSHWVHSLPGGLLHNNIDHLLNKIAEVLTDDEPDMSVMLPGSGSPGAPTSLGPTELRLSLLGRQGMSASGVFSSLARPMGHWFRVSGQRATATLDIAGRSLWLEPSSRAPGALGRVWLSADRALIAAKQAGANMVSFARSEFHFFSGLEELLVQYYRSIQGQAAPPIDADLVVRVARWTERIVALSKAGLVRKEGA